MLIVHDGIENDRSYLELEIDSNQIEMMSSIDLRENPWHTLQKSIEE